MNFKDNSIKIRFSSEHKDLIERAAAIKGLSINDFVVSTLHEKVTHIVKDHNVIELTEEDQKVFVEALLNPPLPNDNLRKAAEELDKVISS